MIVRDAPNIWQLPFVVRGSMIIRILPQICAVAAISLGVVLLQRLDIVEFNPITPLALTVIASVLAIFSSFRNVSSYDRWWEARRNAGVAICDTRALHREAHAYLDDADVAHRISMRCIAFMYAQRDFLRDRPLSDDARRYLPESEQRAVEVSRNGANRLLDFFSADIAAAVKAGNLSPMMAQSLEGRVVSMTNALASVERTKTTPMPFVYTLLVHRTAYAFCFLLPFGLADSAGWWTPLIAAVVSYTFFGLDAIGDELAQPFASDSANTLPLDALARVIEIDILETVEGAEIPPLLAPNNYVLT